MIDKEQLEEFRGYKSMSQREQAVICYLFGVEDGKPKTYEEVCEKFGITKERIRQITAKLLRGVCVARMGRPKRNLRDFLD